MAKPFPVKPANPHRICWGFDKYCPADSMACGNGSDRTQHPVELSGEDWMDWEVGQPPPRPVEPATGLAAPSQ
jgi:hypothetical protein